MVCTLTKLEQIIGVGRVVVCRALHLKGYVPRDDWKRLGVQLQPGGWEVVFLFSCGWGFPFFPRVVVGLCWGIGRCLGTFTALCLKGQ